MPEQQVGINLAEDLITLLCWDDSHGKMVAGLVEPALFPGDYAMIAERAIAYWQEYGAAPKAHIANLIAPELEAGGGRSEHLRRTLLNMDQVHDGLNSEFVVNQITTFVRLQRISDGVLRAAQLISNHGELADIEQLLDEVMRARVLRFERGTRLDDDLEPFLDYLNTQRKEFTTGIVVLDDRGIVPARGEVLLFVAGKGRGKTWFLINVGCENLLKQPGKRVLHLSLEMSEMENRQRYYQRLFSVPKHAMQYTDKETRERRDGIMTPLLKRKCKTCGLEFGRCRCEIKRWEVDKLDKEGRPYNFDFSNPRLRSELETRLRFFGARTSNLIIKRFPNRSLSIDGFASYLDYLADGPEHFVPDLVCLDYARLLKQNARSAADWRISIGQNMEQLRALAIERNFALVTADQLNREGHSKRTARSTHIGEDWSQIHTADTTLIHSATDEEHTRGFSRIFVDHARSEGDKFEVILSQSLARGQFCLDSAKKPADWETRILPQQPTMVAADDGDEDVGIAAEEEMAG